MVIWAPWYLAGKIGNLPGIDVCCGFYYCTGGFSLNLYITEKLDVG